MPDFDKLLNPIIKENNQTLPEINIQEAKKYAAREFPNYDNNITTGTPNNLDLQTKAEMFANMPDKPAKGIAVGYDVLAANQRYDA